MVDDSCVDVASVLEDGGTGTAEREVGVGLAASDDDDITATDEYGGSAAVGAGAGDRTELETTTELDASGTLVEAVAGAGVTVVYCVTITTGGTCSDVVGRAGATELEGSTAVAELGCCADPVFWASVGAAASVGDACDSEDATLDRDADGRTVVYSVLVTNI